MNYINEVKEEYEKFYELYSLFNIGMTNSQIVEHSIRETARKFALEPIQVKEMIKY